LVVINFIRDGKPIALFYLRTGYTPDQYKSELEWNARLKIESSTSIVVPNIRYHLCGLNLIS
jgi:glutathione synthase